MRNKHINGMLTLLLFAGVLYILGALKSDSYASWVVMFFLVLGFVASIINYLKKNK